MLASLRAMNGELESARLCINAAATYCAIWGRAYRQPPAEFILQPSSCMAVISRARNGK